MSALRCPGQHLIHETPNRAFDAPHES